MEVLFERVAGLDVGKDSVTVCVRTPGSRGHRQSETRTFKAMTRSLVVMRDWLLECGHRPRRLTPAARQTAGTHTRSDTARPAQVIHGSVCHLKMVNLELLPGFPIEAWSLQTASKGTAESVGDGTGAHR
jgi:hypothetical protein